MLRELTFKDYHMRHICHYMFALACMILKSLNPSFYKINFILHIHALVVVGIGFLKTHGLASCYMALIYYLCKRHNTEIIIKVIMDYIKIISSY